jgi:hypothetical protein
MPASSVSPTFVVSGVELPPLVFSPAPFRLSALPLAFPPVRVVALALLLLHFLASPPEFPTLEPSRCLPPWASA